jgi:hypothetical protein
LPFAKQTYLKTAMLKFGFMPCTYDLNNRSKTTHFDLQYKGHRATIWGHSQDANRIAAQDFFHWKPLGRGNPPSTATVGSKQNGNYVEFTYDPNTKRIEYKCFGAAKVLLGPKSRTSDGSYNITLQANETPTIPEDWFSRFWIWVLEDVLQVNGVLLFAKRCSCGLICTLTARAGWNSSNVFGAPADKWEALVTVGAFASGFFGSTYFLKK